MFAIFCSTTNFSTVSNIKWYNKSEISASYRWKPSLIRSMGNKSFGRFPVDSPLKSVQETFFNTRPMDWVKKAGSWLEKAFWDCCPLSHWLEGSAMRTSNPLALTRLG